MTTKRFPIKCPVKCSKCGWSTYEHEIGRIEGSKVTCKECVEGVTLFVEYKEIEP